MAETNNSEVVLAQAQAQAGSDGTISRRQGGTPPDEQQVNDAMRAANGATVFGDPQTIGRSAGEVPRVGGDQAGDVWGQPMEGCPNTVIDMLSRIIAKDKLDGQISPFASEKLRETLSGLHESLTSGDASSLRDRLMSVTDPAERRRIVEMLDRNLQNSNANTRVRMGADGNIMLYGSGDQALQIGPNGDMKTMQVHRTRDGSVSFTPQFEGNVDKVYARLSRNAVDNINSTAARIEMPNPFPPTGPNPRPLPRPIPGDPGERLPRNFR